MTPSPRGTDSRKSSTLLFATICTVPGALVGGFVSASANGDPWKRYFWLAAMVAAFLTGAGAWWFLAARRQRYSRRRGAWIGALAGALGHPVCWYLCILSANVCYWTTGGCVGALGEPPVDLFLGLAGAFALSLGSWLLFGVVTVGLGYFAGAAVGRRYAAERPS